MARTGWSRSSTGHLTTQALVVAALRERLGEDLDKWIVETVDLMQ